jgi:hypothetical protein
MRSRLMVICRSAGALMGVAKALVDVSVVAEDGTKIASNAALGATVDEVTLRGRIAQGQITLLRHTLERQQTALAHLYAHPGADWSV